MLDQGGRFHSGVIGRILKHAMFRTIHLPTIDVGHTHIPFVPVWDVTSIMIDVIPWDTTTATKATTNMVFGMFRHHIRMVPVATLAGNLFK